MFDGQATPQHLDEDLTELPGRKVVEEGVDDRAEVEKGVSYRVEDHIAPEVGQRPAGLWNCGHHEATDLVGKPEYHEGRHNEACRESGKQKKIYFCNIYLCICPYIYSVCTVYRSGRNY